MTKTAKIDTCFTSVIVVIAGLDQSVETETSTNSSTGRKLAANITSELRSSRQRIVDMVCAAIELLSQTRSLWNTPEKLSHNGSVNDE